MRLTLAFGGPPVVSNIVFSSCLVSDSPTANNISSLKNCCWRAECSTYSSHCILRKIRSFLFLSWDLMFCEDYHCDLLAVSTCPGILADMYEQIPTRPRAIQCLLCWSLEWMTCDGNQSFFRSENCIPRHLFEIQRLFAPVRDFHATVPRSSQAYWLHQKSCGTCPENTAASLHGGCQD